MRSLALLTLASAFVLGSPLHAQEKKPADKKPLPQLAEEPLAAKFSYQKGVESLDEIALKWTRERKCGACHTNYFYLSARTASADPSPAFKEIRGFFEMRASEWDKNKPRWDTEVVATASFLAMSDAQTGKLNPITRDALDRMWTLQQKDGAWKWLKCGWPPLEHDDYFGALVAALGAGHAPDGYADTPRAREGVARLRGYFKANPPADLHHKAMLLWASLRLGGLMTAKERQDTVDALVARQRGDGGWCLPSLGDWKRRDETPNDPKADSDGYATGLVLYVIHEAKLPVDRKKIDAGLAWLKQHQRASGRWYTRSLNNDRFHYITNAGSTFALMALRAWDER